MNWKIIVIALVAVIGVGVWGWYLQREAPVTESVELAPSGVTPAAVAPSAKSSAVAAPSTERQPLLAVPNSLEDSDGLVRAAVSDFAAQLTQWLTPEEQLRKWVLLVDQIADGKLPLKNRPLSYPMATFMTQRKDEKLFLDEANYARADLLITVITAIPIEHLADYYHAWRPLLDKAYGEIGGSGGFDKRLRTAIKRVLKVQALPTQPELIRPIVYYKYADVNLEAASDIEKLMWRLGPQNAKQVQDYLRKLEPEL
ncbi:MAG TPA: DUF3014 domain-containing protein [Spongiibacteraceae bacterium]|nr:DUF3014 domain-containing protein [Spongiibacteraceae bacterium]